MLHLIKGSHALIASVDDRLNRAEGLQKMKDVSSSLRAIRNLLPSDYRFSEEAPIFICSAGWRCGSTVLQRIACTEETLIWGEPFDKCSLIQHLVEVLAPFDKHWPDESFFLSGRGEDLAEKWIANLYPTATCLVDGIYALIDRLFIKPAQSQGYTRWGIKEVRFGYNEIKVMAFLFPRARFLLLSRDLDESYVSYVGFATRGRFYARWPHKHAFTPYHFAMHRGKVVTDFIHLAEEMDVFCLNYSDIVPGSPKLEDLQDYLGYQINSTALDHKITRGNHTHERPPTTIPRLSNAEKIALRVGEKVGRKMAQRQRTEVFSPN